LYVSLVEACMDLLPVAPGGRGSLSTGVRWALRPRPDSDGKYGRVHAINIETKKTLWMARQRAPMSTGVLATAGGVVFAGAIDRGFSAFDDATGCVGTWLLEALRQDGTGNSPITVPADKVDFADAFAEPLKKARRGVRPAMGNICPEIPSRNGGSGSEPGARCPGRPVAEGQLLGRLLLQERVALPSFTASRTPG